MERRKSRRIPYRKMLKHGINGPENIGYILNIAKDGLSIESRRIYGPGTKLTLYLYVGKDTADENSESTIKIEGVVAWASHTLPGKPSKMGIRLKSSEHYKHIFEDKDSQYKSL